jgi:hypothetical protein
MVKLKHVSAGGQGWERSFESYHPICELLQQVPHGVGRIQQTGCTPRVCSDSQGSRRDRVAQHTATATRFQILPRRQSKQLNRNELERCSFCKRAGHNSLSHIHLRIGSDQILMRDERSI